MTVSFAILAIILINFFAFINNFSAFFTIFLVFIIIFLVFLTTNLTVSLIFFFEVYDEVATWEVLISLLRDRQVRFFFGQVRLFFASALKVFLGGLEFFIKR